MTLPPILAIPTDGCGLIGAVWPGLYLEMSLWSLKGKGQRTKMVFYSTFCLFMWQRILSPRTSICISLATLCYKRFWERKWLHFQLLIGGGKEEGNQNGSSDPTIVSPQEAKLKSLWQKHQVVPDVKAYLCQRLWPALITPGNLDYLVVFMLVEFLLDLVQE